MPVSCERLESRCALSAIPPLPTSPNPWAVTYPPPEVFILGPAPQPPPAPDYPVSWPPSDPLVIRAIL